MESPPVRKGNFFLICSFQTFPQSYQEKENLFQWCLSNHNYIKSSHQSQGGKSYFLLQKVVSSQHRLRYLKLYTQKLEPRIKIRQFSLIQSIRLNVLTQVLCELIT